MKIKQLIKLAIVALAFALRVEAETVFTDNFNSGASPLWGNERGSWVATFGVYNAQSPTNTPPTFTSLPFILADLTFDVDINQVSDGGIWLHTDAAGQNGILLVTGGRGWGSNSGDPQAGKDLYWHVITNGNASPQLAEVFNVFNPGDNAHLTVTVTGNTYKAFVNGTLQTTFVDNTFPSGRVGLYDFSPAGNPNQSIDQTFDNVQITQPSCVTPPSDMVSWWPGDGNAFDIQGGNNGALENGATFAPGRVGQAFSFNRNLSQFVEVPDAPNIRFGGNLPMSVDFWIYRTDPSTTQHFIGKRVTCSGDGNGTFQMGVDFVFTQDCGVQFGPPLPSGQTVCSGQDLPMNTWTHLAGTFDGTTQRLYMNGQLIGHVDAPLGPPNTEPLLIGGVTQTGQCGQQTTGGLMDEVEIFNRALSQAEVQAIFNAGSAGKCKANLLNISTRMRVLTGDQALIAGFIVTGTDPKRGLLRGIGPSLTGVGVTLSDPTLELHQGSSTLATNDNWKINDQTGQSQEVEIRATGIPPTNDLESAILAMLSPGAYTAILAGKNGGTGVGLVELYDLAQGANSKLANISTRGFVDTGNNVMIGGLIVGGGAGGIDRVLVRALGPSIPVAGALADPTLELHDGNGTTIATNDNWKMRPDGTSQQAEIEATTIPPTNDLESALVQTLPLGNYTAIVQGKNNTTGIGLVEAYSLQ
jgi:hypothetical protein